MTKQLRIRLAWAAIIALLLGGAHVIVARNAPNSQAAAPSGFVH